VGGNGLRWIKERKFTEKFCVGKRARIFYGEGGSMWRILGFVFLAATLVFLIGIFGVF